MKSTQLSLVLVGLYDFRSFQTVRRMHEAWKRECSVSVFFVRVGSQISQRRAKKDSNIPSPGRTRSVKCPTPGPTKTIKSPPHALPPSPPPPRQHNIDRCIKKIATTGPRLTDTPSNWYRHNCTQCWKLLLIQQYGSFYSFFMFKVLLSTQ